MLNFWDLKKTVYKMFIDTGGDPLEHILEPLDKYKISDVEKIISYLGLCDDVTVRGLTKVLRRVVGVYEGQNRLTDEEKDQRARDALVEIYNYFQENGLIPEPEPLPEPDPEPEPLPEPDPEPEPLPEPDPEPDPIPIPDIDRVLRPGLWVGNGPPARIDLMYAWKPTGVTSFFDYLQFNRVHQYKQDNPDVPIIIRFQHNKGWHNSYVKDAVDKGKEIASKWPDIKNLDPYVYFANEMNLHYENGDENGGNQWMYETPQFYQKYADWVRITADTIKQLVPDMKLVTPPFAFGHMEDGAPDDFGNIREGWVNVNFSEEIGYDFLSDTVKTYFDNILTGHYYWGDGTGRVRDRLYHPETSKWYAFRWRKLLTLFKKRYGIDAKIIIDEAGSFDCTTDEFTKDVLYYSQECLSDPRVIALTFFLWSDPTHQDGKFPNGNMANDWVYNIKNLNHHIDQLTNTPLGWIRDAIKSFESGGDYSARNPNSTASGAYQYLDSTWANYDNKPRAYLASPEVQDQRMMEDLVKRQALYNNDVRKIIGAHYLPAWVNRPEKWDDTTWGLSLRQYVDNVLKNYWRK